MQVYTVDIPYQAREAKLSLDERSIYKFGMGLNMSGLKDTSATTNIAIKAAYALLEMRCNKIIDRLEMLLMDLVNVVLDEINETNETGYTAEQVYLDITPELMTNAVENAQIALTQSQNKQVMIATLLQLATYFDDETLMQNICEVLDIEYEEIKDKLPDFNEPANNLEGATNTLEV